jgi:hypothetical protein
MKASGDFSRGLEARSLRIRLTSLPRDFIDGQQMLLEVSRALYVVGSNYHLTGPLVVAIL